MTISEWIAVRFGPKSLHIINHYTHTSINWLKGHIALNVSLVKLSMATGGPNNKDKASPREGKLQHYSSEANSVAIDRSSFAQG